MVTVENDAWQRVDVNTFVRRRERDVVVDSLVVSRQKQALHALPEYRTVENEIRESKYLELQMNTLVGTVQPAARLEIGSLKDSLLSRMLRMTSARRGDPFE
jgi:hypothetical protein